jgi:hypothetical protein
MPSPDNEILRALKLILPAILSKTAEDNPGNIV